MITISMDVRSAAAVRQALFDEQKRYTYDPSYECSTSNCGNP